MGRTGEEMIVFLSFFLRHCERLRGNLSYLILLVLSPLQLVTVSLCDVLYSYQNAFSSQYSTTP